MTAEVEQRRLVIVEVIGSACESGTCLLAGLLASLCGLAPQGRHRRAVSRTAVAGTCAAGESRCVPQRMPVGVGGSRGGVTTFFARGLARWPRPVRSTPRLEVAPTVTDRLDHRYPSRLLVGGQDDIVGKFQRH